MFLVKINNNGCNKINNDSKTLNSLYSKKYKYGLQHRDSNLYVFIDILHIKIQ